MNILVTGGTGFIGTRLIKRLVADPRVSRIIALHRRAIPADWHSDKLVPLRGDLETLSTYRAEVPIHVAVHLAGFWKSEDRKVVDRINRAGTQHVVDFCTRNGHPNVVFTSSINVKLKRTGAYAASKRAAEAIVGRSGLRYIIFRPTLVYGRGDTGLTRIIRAVERLLWIPVFGDGQKLEQPIHVDELVDFLHQSIFADCHEITLEVGGKDCVTFNDLVHTIAHTRNRNVSMIHIPAGAALAVTKIAEALHLPFPITSEQIFHMDEDLTADSAQALALFPVELASLEEHLRRDYETNEERTSH